MDQPSPPGAGRQLVDGYGSRHRKEVSENHGIAVCAEGSGGHINMEFSGFEGTPEEGGRVAGGWGGGRGGCGYDECGSVMYFYDTVGADL